MEDIVLLGKYIQRKLSIKKALIIISFSLIWIICGLCFWYIESPLWLIISGEVVVGILLYTWFYCIKVNDMHTTSLVDKLGNQRKLLYYLKDPLLIEVLKGKNLSTNKEEEIKVITNLAKSISTIEASILINEILRKGGFTNYTPKTDDRDFEEN